MDEKKSGISQVNKSKHDYNPDTIDGKPRLNGFYIGFVKNNQDVQRMGRLQVYIPELGGSPTDSSTWYTVGYASPFAGATKLGANSTQISYGFWGVPPDLDNQVLICFASGDPAQGFWFACLWQTLMNHMVPGVAINKTSDNGGQIKPVMEYNKNDSSQSSNYWQPNRPTFTPLDTALTSQGLYTDPERGTATTSARRESPSQVFGITSPRSNNIHIDDNINNEFIRLRTRSGVQLLLHESTGYIYMNSKNGNSWMEISDDGIDMYSLRSISLRAQENVNIHADGSVIMYSAGAIHHSAANVTSYSQGQHQHVSQGVHTRTAARLNEQPKNNGANNPANNVNPNASGAPGTGNSPGAQAKPGVTVASVNSLVGSPAQGNTIQCVGLTKSLFNVGPAYSWQNSGTSLADVYNSGYDFNSNGPLPAATFNFNNGTSYGNPSNPADAGGVSGMSHTFVVTGYADANGNPISSPDQSGNMTVVQQYPTNGGTSSTGVISSVVNINGQGPKATNWGNANENGSKYYIIAQPTN